MSRHAPAPAHRSSFISLSLTLALLLSSLSALVAPWSSTAAHGIATQPRLTHATVTTATSGMLMVQGNGFTPGGPVHLIVYDRWGEDVYQDIWTVADTENHDPYGSIGPTQGPIEGGVVRQLFSFVVDEAYTTSSPSISPGTAYSRPDGAGLMVRAYDGRSQTWSNVLDAEIQAS